ncbi:MAG TPA: hypothetical protein VIW92_04920, partial [Thermoanaerobaculia bacterium]
MFWAHAIGHRDGTELDGIHLLWAPPRFAGLSVDGFDIWRRRGRQRPEFHCHQLTDGELQALQTALRVETPVAAIRLRLGPCPQPLAKIPDEAVREDGILESGEGGRGYEQRPAERRESPTEVLRQWALREQDLRPVAEKGLFDPVKERLAMASRVVVTDASGLVAPQQSTDRCLVYEFLFQEDCTAVRVEMGVAGGMALAFQDGKAVQGAPLTASGGVAFVEFLREGIDRVLVWTGRWARPIRVCCVHRGKDWREEWQGAELIVKNLQVPFREVHPGLPNVAAEINLAESRLFPGEDLGPGDFESLSNTMNDAVADATRSPVQVSRMVRSTEEQPFIEIQPWSSGLMLTLQAHWRRALGFGYRDRDGLVPGQPYDYLIVGRFRRRDVEEELLGFHTVPLGTPLPGAFRLGPFTLDPDGHREVAAHPPVPSSGHEHTFRKGLAFDGRLTIGFPEPVTRVVLELEPARTPGLGFRALSGGLIFGLADIVDSGSVPVAPRVELTFPDPVARLELTGRGFLYGIRRSPVPPGVDPDDIVERVTAVYGAVFAPTPLPDAPPVLGTVNLQHPPLTGDPAVTVQDVPNLLGFKLYWLPPSSGGWPPGYWPPDLPAAPPSDVVGYYVDRR